MADDEIRAALGAQQRLEPDDAGEIEVVGRLVEQQHVGGAGELAGDGEPLQPAAGERLDRRVRVDEAGAAERLGDPSAASASCSSTSPATRLAHDLLGGRRRREARVLRHVADARQAAERAGAASGSSSPARIRSSVDLPEPFGPTTPRRSPSAIAEREVGEERGRSERLADALAGDERAGIEAPAGAPQAPPYARPWLARQLLDPVLGLQRVAPAALAPRPDSSVTGRRRAGVARGASRRLAARAPRQVLGGAGVERPVTAAQDVDEGQGLCSRRSGAASSHAPCAPPHNRPTVNRGHEYRERVSARRPPAAQRARLAVPALRALGSRRLERAPRSRRSAGRRRDGGREGRAARRAGARVATSALGGARRPARLRDAPPRRRTSSPSRSRAACRRSRTAASSSTRCSRRVRRAFPGAVPMHRLGRGTSGLVLFARTNDARRGRWPPSGAGRASRRSTSPWSRAVRPARRSPSSSDRPRAAREARQVHAASADGRPAVSHVRVVGERGDEARSSGHDPDGPSAPDPDPPRGRRPSARRRSALRRGRRPGADPALPGEGGYWLHAHRLALDHPATRRRLELECAPPPSLRA